MTDPAIHRWDDGVTWLAQPEEALLRASHALSIDGEVIVLEPVAYDGLDDLLATVGPVDGVAVLMNLHTRDAARVAARHDAALLVPDGFDLVDRKLDVPTAPLEARLDGTDWSVRTLIDGRFRQEAALWSAPSETLFVPESVGTAWYFTTGDEPVGIHPLSRIVPPTDGLAGLRPRRLLVGHGHPVDPVAGGALDRALRTARRRLPRAWANAAYGWVTRG